MKKDETIHKLLTEQRESSAKQEDKIKVIQCLEDTVKELKKKITDLNEKVCECKVEVHVFMTRLRPKRCTDQLSDLLLLTTQISKFQV